MLTLRCGMHQTGGEQWAYNDGLAALCASDDIAKTPSWRKDMYDESGEANATLQAPTLTSSATWCDLPRYHAPKGCPCVGKLSTCFFVELQVRTSGAHLRPTEMQTSRTP